MIVDRDLRILKTIIFDKSYKYQYYNIIVSVQLFLDQHLHETVEVKPIDFFEQHTSNVAPSTDNFLSNNFTPLTSPKQVCVIIVS